MTTRCLIGVLVGSVSGLTADVFFEFEATSSRLTTGESSAARLLPATEPVDVSVVAAAISAAEDSKAVFSFRFLIFSLMPLKIILSRARRLIRRLNDRDV